MVAENEACFSTFHQSLSGRLFWMPTWFASLSASQPHILISKLPN